MLLLNILGGGLPPGVLIRESPTLQSSGALNMYPSGGGYYINSFFTVYTELSFDGGAHFTPSVGNTEVYLTNPNGIPTLSQWGLISLAGLFLFTGFFFIYRKNGA